MPSPSLAPDPRAGRAAPGLSRRGLLVSGGLGGAAGLTLLTGCAAPTARPEAGAVPSATGTPTATPTSIPAVTPDVALATTALAEIRVVREAVAATRRRYPALGRALGDVTAMHRTHEDALVDAVPPQAPPVPSPSAYAVLPRRPDALVALRALEQSLQTRLGDLAVQARSGVFAGLLGSMSAGIAQRVARWPT